MVRLKFSIDYHNFVVFHLLLYTFCYNFDLIEVFFSCVLYYPV